MLIIDSHNAEINEKKVFNLHLRNSILLRDTFNADLVTLPKHLQEKDYKKVVFVHSSQYSKARHFKKFIHETLDDPELWYICNDYNLGEPDALWGLCHDYGYKYNVIANHQPEHSKITTKHVKEWHICNLNALCYESLEKPNFNQVSSFFDTKEDYRMDIVYFGAWRKGREIYFKKYFDREFPVSTSKRNIKKWEKNGVFAMWNNPLNWHGKVKTLFDFKSSLYIEDEKTHEWYSHLANRWYEALSYSIPTFFDKSCLNTIKKANLEYPDCFIVDGRDELREKLNMGLWKADLSYQKHIAEKEKLKALGFIERLLG